MKKYGFEISVVILLITLTVIGLSMGSKDVEIKEIRKAMYFNKMDDNKVKCTLCPFNCVLSPGQTGACKARKNEDGEMVSLTYGKPVSLAIDPIEKKPLFHFYPGTQVFSLGTAGCNLHCNFCQNWQISQASPETVPNYEISSQQIVQKAIESGSKSIAFTYNEPIVFYEMMLETAKLAKQKGLKTVMVTNGYINQKPLEELAEYIDAANVDLKAFTEKFYKEYTGATLKPVLESMKTLKKKGVFIEVTNLIIPGANDTEKEIRELCEWIKKNLGEETPLHFSRFFPAYNLKNVPPTPVETLKTAKKIAEEVGLKHVYIGNVITEGGENTICPKCGKVLIKRERYNVRKNRLENGKCPKCGKEIKGMFEKKRVREEAVAGMWYPDNAAELMKVLEKLDAQKCDKKGSVENVAGLIVPHAGFVYSGPTAACGFKALKEKDYEVAVILGTSHRYRAGVVSVYDGAFAKTPIGNLKINRELTEKLLKSDEKIDFIEKIHTQEHSLEAELPFVRHYLGDIEIVLILASTEDEKTLLKTGKVIADWIRTSGKKTLVIESSDMSHYHSYEDAVKMDRKTISLIEEGKFDELKTAIMSKKCELCGYDSLKMFLEIMKGLDALKPELIHYENSGDAVPASREKGVVGYMAMTFSKKEKANYYDDNLRKKLLESARESITYTLKNKKEFKPEKPSEPKLNEERAVFVTLKINGELRGCIGQMFASQPLYLAVTEMAHSAAFNDHRFKPLTEDELKKVHIEISVLTPMQKVENWKEIKNGIDGVWIKKGYRSGVFLPQVATETGWDLETFLSNLCTHKAGLPADCYKDPETEIFKYQVELFEE